MFRPIFEAELFRYIWRLLLESYRKIFFKTNIFWWFFAKILVTNEVSSEIWIFFWWRHPTSRDVIRVTGRNSFLQNSRKLQSRSLVTSFFVFYKLWYDKRGVGPVPPPFCVGLICGAPTLTLRHLCTDPILFRTHPLLGLLVRYHYRWEGAKIARWKKLLEKWVGVHCKYASKTHLPPGQPPPPVRDRGEKHSKKSRAPSTKISTKSRKS